MPTYEYRCANGHEFEVFQRMSDDPVSTCPECGAEAERLLSPGAGLLFKGSGFYITDYRNKDYQKKAEGEKPASGDGGAGDSGKTSTASSDGGTSDTGPKSE